MMNAITGAATARRSTRSPPVVVAGDVPSYYRGRGPHQELNLHAEDEQWQLYRPFAKRSWRVDRVEDLPRFTERAFWTAQSGRPGAVLLSVPMDFWSRSLDGSEAARYLLPADTYAPALHGGVAERIVARLARAKRPLWLYVPGRVRSPDIKCRSAQLCGAARPADRALAHGEGCTAGQPSAPDGHDRVLGYTARQRIRARGRSSSRTRDALR